MFTTLQLFFSFITVFIKVLKPGGTKTIAAENMLLRQQLIVAQRHRKRTPNLTTADRTVFGILTAMLNPSRLSKSAISIKPATLLKFHKALVKRKYHLLFSRKSPNRPGRKGPSKDIINLIVEMKQRNPRFGYLRIAMLLHCLWHSIRQRGYQAYS
jgi:putative transposase